LDRDETASEVDDKEETVVLVDKEVEVVRGETPMVVMAGGFPLDRQALVGRSRWHDHGTHTCEEQDIPLFLTANFGS
jgi:hypothetical protein